MKTLIINGQLLNTLIQTRFPDGVAGLQERWDADGGLHRTTVYRWTQGHLPQTSRSLLQLAGLLDCDPLALLTPSSTSWTTAIDRTLALFQRDRLPPALGFLREFLGRQAAWPPESIAQDYFGRKWFMEEIVHDPRVRSSYYAVIELFGSPAQSEVRPQVYHFAFRYPKLFDKRWLHYGFVTRHGQDASLVHINGYNDRYRVVAGHDPTRVETFFGPEDAIFRVVSLHAFTAHVRFPETCENARMRFPA